MRRRHRALIAAVVGPLMLAPAFVVAAHANPAGPPCTQPTPAGGDWPAANHDLANTRSQPSEDALTPATVGRLRPAWVFSTKGSNPSLSFTDLNATPVVAGGCVFIATSNGDVFAIDASRGGTVWHQHVPLGPSGAGFGGLIVSAPAVDAHDIYFIVSQLDAPYVIALDRSSGAVAWRSDPIETYPGVFSNATAVLWDGLLVAGFSPPEGDPKGHGGFAIIDAATGHLVLRTYTIPKSDWAAGYAGGGIWTTPAVDPATGYAYMGAGNPFSKKIEHPRTNAILKVDLDRRRPTFGQIVASYKGEIDQFSPVLRQIDKPVCQLLPQNPTVPEELPLPPAVPDLHQLRDSFTCLQMDLDFGAPANLIPGRDGRLLVGDLQKSGVYHLVDASQMTRVEDPSLGLTCLVCNGAATAFDNARRQVDAAVAPGTIMRALDIDRGTPRWTAPIVDGVHYEGVSTAAGVAYTIDTAGFFDAFDATNGAVLVKRPVALDAGLNVFGLSSSGIAIAQHTVYVAAGSNVVAYRV